jgi:hypothetical protein
MPVTKVRFFIEGEGDQKFVLDLVEYVFGVTLNPDNFFLANGYCDNWIDKNKPNFLRAIVEGFTPVVIVDSDSNFQNRKKEIVEGAKVNNLVFDYFLFPNNHDNGTLEDLLMKLILPKHKKLFTCFDNYRECIQPYKSPDNKAKIFAYVEALSPKHVKEKNRDYKNEEIWLLKAPELETLISFLKNALKI